MHQSEFLPTRGSKSVFQVVSKHFACYVEDGLFLKNWLQLAMHVALPYDLAALAGYIDRFIALVGRERWFRRVDHLDAEQRTSPNRWKIVADYHWLEMALSFQANVLAKEARLLPELVDELVLASLNFAASVVEIHTRLSPRGKQVLEGRLRDALKAETGFSPIYLELDLAQRLMNDGCEVEFADLEDVARFDLLFSRNSFSGEVECKSLSADAGRQIHRKDFYRFMEAINPALRAHIKLRRQEVIVVTLEGRLSPNSVAQAALLQATADALKDGAPALIEIPEARIERQPYADVLASAPIHDPRAFYKFCGSVFGSNIHVSGGLTEDGGCLVVMRSRRKDDTSKPMLEAMRKASSQFSGKRPAFIAIQEHGIDPADFMLPHVGRRAAILSYALFKRYGGAHINATYFTGFGAVVTHNGLLGTPGFSIPNPEPMHSINSSDAALFLMPVSDSDYYNF